MRLTTRARAASYAAKTALVTGLTQTVATYLKNDDATPGGENWLDKRMYLLSEQLRVKFDKARKILNTGTWMEIERQEKLKSLHGRLKATARKVELAAENKKTQKPEQPDIYNMVMSPKNSIRVKSRRQFLIESEGTVPASVERRVLDNPKLSAFAALEGSGGSAQPTLPIRDEHEFLQLAKQLDSIIF
jgi:hypothetical protein